MAEVSVTPKLPLPQGWMGKRSRRWLAQQARAAKRIIEVGVWKGLSTRVLAESTRGTVWAVDHWQGTPDSPDQHQLLYAAHLGPDGGESVYREFVANLARQIRTRRVIPVRLHSVAAASYLLETHGRVFDFIFVDGDHSYEGCAADIVAYRPLVRRGGLLAGHDYHERWPGVVRAVNEHVGRVTLGPHSIWSVRV